MIVESSKNYKYSDLLDKSVETVSIAEASFKLIILVVAVIANSLLCLIVMMKSKMQTTTNLILVNLAVADILLAIIKTSSILNLTFSMTWRETTCGAVSYTSRLCEIFVVLAIASPFVITLFCQKMLKFIGLIIIGYFWIFAAVYSLPSAFYPKICEIDENYYCLTEIPHGTLFLIFEPRFSSFFFYLIPITVITVSLALHKFRMSWIINRRQEMRSLFAIVIIHILLFTPWMVVENFQFFNNSEKIQFLFSMSYLLTLVSMVYKPFICFFWHCELNQEIRQLMPCCGGSAIDKLESPNNNDSTQQPSEGKSSFGK